MGFWAALPVTVPLMWWLLIFVVILILLVVCVWGAREQFRVNRQHRTSDERYADHSLSATRDAWFDEHGIEHKYRQGTPLSKGEKPWVIPPVEPGEPPAGGSGSTVAK